MRHVLDSRTSNVITSDIEAMLLKVYIALGICSMEKQIRLLSNIRASIAGSYQRMVDFYTLINASPSNHPLWINPIEPNGVRIAITNGDYFVFDILKQLFGSIADGIISPVMHSPYHSQGASDRVQDGELLEEIVIFNPSASLEPVDNIAYPSYHLSTYLRNNYTVRLHTRQPYSTSIYHVGGLTSSSHIDTIAHRDLSTTFQEHPAKRKTYKKQLKMIKPWIRAVKKHYNCLFIFKDPCSRANTDIIPGLDNLPSPSIIIGTPCR